jgi:transposase-like protein
MGMYDSVKVPCPDCKTIQLFQSKSGPCNLNEYTLHNMPVEVAIDINRHAPYKCENCGLDFGVLVKTIVQATPVSWAELNDNDDEEYDEDG